MTPRRILLFFASLALGAVLMFLLVRVAKLDIGAALSQLRTARPLAIAKLLVLNAVLILLSTEKWRSVDSVLRTTVDLAPSRPVSFVLTSIGMALGFVLPVQLGMAVARTMGTYFYGKPLRRGMAGSLFEQSFDVLMVFVLAITSGITLALKGGGWIWTVLAVATVALTLLLAGVAMRVSRSLAAYMSSKMSPERKIAAGLRRMAELEQSGILSTRLARRLVLLSAVRFGIVVLMAEQTAAAVSAQIPLWHLAAAMPLVVLATALAITPGGVGVTELTYTGALGLFGSPVSEAAGWSVANRVLCIASSFVVGFVAVTILAMARIVTSRKTLRATQYRSSGDLK